MKKPNLPYLKRKLIKGQYEYWYFARRGQKEIRLPSPDEPNFFTEYERAKNGKIVKPPTRTFNKLIIEYRKGDRFKNLSDRTRRDYQEKLQYISDNVGSRDPAQMTTLDVIEAMQANEHRKRFANYLQQIFSILFQHARRIGWVDNNPAQGVEKYKTGKGHSPWPQGLLDAYEAACAPMDR